jgi:GTP-binding protein
MLINPYTKAVFLKSSAKVSQLPSDEGYEVAFAGRSNAGKSSALNYLTNKRSLARTSKTPGRTQLINLFTLGDDDHRLVDLPGYGYAKVAIKIKEDWQKHLAHYLEARKSLRGLVLLMDIRHPLKDLDKLMIDWAFNRELPVHILLTKCDKLNQTDTHNAITKVRKHYDLMPEDALSVQVFSTIKKKGLPELVCVLNKWMGWSQEPLS